MARQHPRTIAYLRVSTHEQDVAKNQADILLLAHRQQLGQVQFVEETVSGRVPWRRRKIAQVLDTLEAGDTLVVSELSRLGRSMLECMEILALAAQKASTCTPSKATGSSTAVCKARSSPWRSPWPPRLSGS